MSIDYLDLQRNRENLKGNSISMDISIIESKVHVAVQESLMLDKPIRDNNISLRDDLDADSIDLVTLFMSLEEEFPESIGELDPEEAERLNTIQDVIDFSVKKMEEMNHD